jgi:hypothetical protein
MNFTKLIFLILILISSKFILAQNINFELNIAEDSLEIKPGQFINSIDGSNYVGIVLKRSLSQNSEVFYYKPFIYKINQYYGDTVSYEFTKEDTLLYYYNITSINYGIPGFLLSGQCNYTNDNNYNTIFTRVDTNFNIIWERILSLHKHSNLYMMKTLGLKDSSFLCLSSSFEYKDMFFQKIGLNGDSMTFRRYESDTAGFIWDLTYNHDSTGYIVHNRWGFYETGASSCSMIEFNNNFEYRQHKFYEEYVIPELSAKLLSNGNLLTCGNIYRGVNDSTFEEYIGVYMYDKDLNLLYKRELTDPAIPSKPGLYAIDYSCPSCIYVAGTDNFQSFGGNEPDWYYLAKLNDTLGIEFEKYIGGDDYYWLQTVTSSVNGTVLLGGYKTEVGGPWFYNDAYFVELDSLGCITSSNINNEDITIKDLIVYPNPGHNKLSIRTALKDCEFKLYNMDGKLIVEKEIIDHITYLNTEHLQSGTYVYTVNFENRIIDSGKWIRQ